jgi:hypothetical protein
VPNRPMQFAGGLRAAPVAERSTPVEPGLVQAAVTVAISYEMTR